MMQTSARSELERFLSITVVSLIAAALSTVFLPGAFNTLFPIYWAIGIAGWLVILVRKSPELSSAFRAIRSDLTPTRKCRYCRYPIKDKGKCPNCGASA